MDTSHLPQDHSNQAVFDPHPTQAFRARQLATDLKQVVDDHMKAIKDLVARIETHRRPRGVVIVKARQIHAEIARLVGGGKISINDIDRLDMARADLRDLLAALDDVAEAAEQAGTTVEVRAATDLEPAANKLPALVQQVLATRQQLPDVSRWPWRDRAARRQVRAWNKAWRLTLDTPIDQQAVEQQWTKYLAALPPASPKGA